MKRLILIAAATAATLAQALPVNAGGLGDTVYAPEPVSPAVMRAWLHARHSNDGRHQNPATRQEPNPGTQPPGGGNGGGEPDPRMSKDEALATHGLGRGNWKGLPADLQPLARENYLRERKGEKVDWKGVAKK